MEALEGTKRRVWVIRHAKSSWDDVSLSDKERPLKKRGKNDAALVGAFLSKNGVKFDAVLSSPAKRARQTAKIVLSEVGGFPFADVKIQKKLYFCGTDPILRVLSKLDKSVKVVAIFGHNPDFDSFLRRCGRPADSPDLTTCGCACVDFNVADWKQIQFDQAHIVNYTTPKLLKE